MARLELTDVTIVANDTGGAITQLLLVRRPERIARVVLTPCDAFENFLPPAFRPLQWAAKARLLAADAAGDAHPRAATHAAGLRPAHQAPVPRRRARGLGAPRAEQPRRPRGRAALHPPHRQAPTLDAATKLGGFDRPVLLAWAPRTGSSSSRSRSGLRQCSPDARLEPIPDAWTFLPEDQPDVLAGLDRRVRRQPLAAEDARRHRAGDRRKVAREPRRTGASAISGRRSPIACASSASDAPICRSARVWLRAPPRTPSAIHASMRSRWPGSARRSARVERRRTPCSARAAAFVTSGSDGRAIQRRDRQVRAPR